MKKLNLNIKKKLPEEFLAFLRELENSYIQSDDPMIQSGTGSDYVRWRREKSIILKAIEEDGTFLDACCANGYLLECLVQWAGEKGINLIPYGVDIGAKLIELAKKRLPSHSSNFWAANSYDWIPPIKFDYVYTLHDCVPDEFLKDYITHLLSHYVKPNGTLIIGAYGSTSRQEPARDIEKDLRGCGFAVDGVVEEGDLPVVGIVWMKVAGIS